MWSTFFSFDILPKLPGVSCRVGVNKSQEIVVEKVLQCSQVEERYDCRY